MVFGILGDQYGGIIVWAYTFQKKSAVRKLRESEISHFDFLKINFKPTYGIQTLPECVLDLKTLSETV